MLDRIESWIEGCREIVRGGVRVAVGLVCVGAVIALASQCVGCTSSGGVDGAKVRSIACAGAAAVQTFFCGDSPIIGPSSGGEAYSEEHDPEAGGLGDEDEKAAQ